MNTINSFTFYRDYFNLIDTIPTKDKKEILIAIVDYVFKDIEPKLSGHNQAIFNTLKAQLNLSKSNSKRRTERKPNENQNETKKEPNDEPKENKTSILSFKFYISNFKFIENNKILSSKVEEWLKYKTERKEYYKETGLKTLLKRIEENAIKYGIDEIVSLIDNSMSNNYKGIIFDKLKGKPIKEKVPEWFNKEVEEELLSDEELAEFEKELAI